LLARQEQTGWETFAERFIRGREYWVSFIEQPGGAVRVFPPAEAIFTDYAPGQAPDYITYRAKWAKESFEYHHLKAAYTFSAEEAPLITHLETLTRATWQALHLRAYGRIDFRVDRQGQPWILDVNINPYLPYHAGGLLDSAQQVGWDFQRLLAEVIGPLS
jgi:D-alanine-D-alanine ligase